MAADAADMSVDVVLTEPIKRERLMGAVQQLR
jgi:hypothetical protein